MGLAAPHVRCGSAGRSMQIRVQAGVRPMLVWVSNVFAILKVK